MEQVKDGLARLGWRVYKHFYNHINKRSQAHFFPPQMATNYGSSYVTLCGRQVSSDYVDDHNPRPDMDERFYCKTCLEMVAKMDPEKKKRWGLNE